MKILITGATGFVGSALLKALLAEGHKLYVLTRNAEKAIKYSSEVKWVETLDFFSDFNHVDAVINLAGEPIFNQAWQNKQKIKLTQSRVKTTEKLVELINRSNQPPRVFISGSAMGFYGNSNTLLTEQVDAGKNFTAKLCQQWEATALQANTRVCILRIGMVFALHGGAFQRIYKIFKCNLGGKLGNGDQYWAWISLIDTVRGILFLLSHSECEGAFNFVTPELITNKTFTQQLSQYLHRTAFFSVPEFMLRFIFGERADLFLDSQKGYPAKLLEAGFIFRYNNLADFLRSLPINESNNRERKKFC